MASADCVISFGGSVSTTAAKGGATECIIFAGVGVSATRVAWAGTTARRQAVDWLPPAHVSPLLPNGKWSPVWYRFFREMAETRLGGAQGVSVPTVVTRVTDTQSAVVEAVSFAQQVGQYAQGIAATVDATVQVAQDSSLSGSESIPDTPIAPTYEP